MIKVNLKSTGKVTSGGNEFVANVDFSGLNLKVLILCAALGYGPGILYFGDEWAAEKSVLTDELGKLNIEAKRLKDKENSMVSYSKQLEDLEEKEKTIRKRLMIVNQVTEKRNNPMKIMHFVAEHIPEDIWLTQMRVEDRNFYIKGYALTYKSIGKFIGHLKESIFFGQRVNLEDYVSKEVDGSRVQEFDLRAVISKFELKE